jgi:IS5 family transposase
MRPRRPPAQEPDGLFKTALERFIDMDHPLVRLADRIDWEGLEEQVAGSFAEAGRPGNGARFMLGMLMLKAMYDLSDEKLWERWPCDPYFQYFTGELYFQHRVPHQRSGLSHWRGRLGEGVLDELLRESLRVAHATGALSGRDMAAVSVDTTVQEKAIRFPTDAGLVYEALVRLGAEARAAGLKLRQSYVRVGKQALIRAGRYGHAKQFKRRNRMIRFLKARLGRVIREIERQTAGDDELAAGFADSLAKAQTIRDQALVKRAGRKIYSWHAPEVECIGKGKARAPYEFGCKATVTTTNGRARGGMFVLHAAALHGNPFDGHTLGRVLAETAEMTGVTPKRVHVDKGYRGHRQDRAVFDPETRRDVPPPLARLHLRATKAPARTQGRAAAPRRHRTRHRPPQSRPPHGSKPPQGPPRRPLQRQDGCRRLQPAPPPAMAAGLRPIPDLALARNHQINRQNRRLLTDDEIGRPPV